jgi:AraC-like DNA-binding protein
MLNVTRFGVSHPALKKWVKFFWHLKTDAPVEVEHMLFPTDSIDVVINLSSPIHYNFSSEVIKAGQCHVNGRRDSAATIMQSGQLRLFGISFEPYGLYPFFKIPVNQFNNQLVDLWHVSAALTADIKRAICAEKTTEQTIRLLEDALMRYLDVDSRDADAAKALQLFQQWDSSISAFCNQFIMDIKQLERLCLKYTGLNPKKLKRIARVQSVNRQILEFGNRKALTALAYDNDYFDQSHFIREFRTFMGLTPDQFRQYHATVKDITRYSYQ